MVLASKKKLKKEKYQEKDKEISVLKRGKRGRWLLDEGSRVISLVGTWHGFLSNSVVALEDYLRWLVMLSLS